MKRLSRKLKTDIVVKFKEGKSILGLTEYFKNQLSMCHSNFIPRIIIEKILRDHMNKPWPIKAFEDKRK